MTRDEIRGLIGGYATGSLSEAERKTLFEAALDDQELFDELAREQALKELLDAPGVKTRLIGALTPRRKNAWWANAWVWAATGAFAVAVITGVALFEKPREVQIAQVTAPPTLLEPQAGSSARQVAPPTVAPRLDLPAQVVPRGCSQNAAPAIPEPAPRVASPPPPKKAAPRRRMPPCKKRRLSRNPNHRKKRSLRPRLRLQRRQLLPWEPTPPLAVSGTNCLGPASVAEPEPRTRRRRGRTWRSAESWWRECPQLPSRPRRLSGLRNQPAFPLITA